MPPRFLPVLFSSIAILVAPRHLGATSDLSLLTVSAAVTPNVMLVLDNSPSMRTSLGGSTRIEEAGTTFVNLIEQILPDDASGGYIENARLGLTIFEPSDDHLGGEVLVPIGSSNKQQLIDNVNSTVSAVLDGKGSRGTLLAETLVDVGRYFAGEHGIPNYPALRSTSPIDLECRKNFVVFMTDGEPYNDLNDHYGSSVPGTSAHSSFVATIGNADGDANECSSDAPATCIDAPSDGRDDGITYGNNGTDWFDDVAYYLSNVDLIPTLSGTQNLVTYTIGFAIDHPLLSETAVNGKGRYFTAGSASALATALSDAFGEIFDQAASFSAVAVPSSRVPGGDAIFSASFKPSLADPFWEGNLDAYYLTKSGQILANDWTSAIDPNTGEFYANKSPFWSAGEVLRTNSSRNLYTTRSSARTDFTTGSITPSDLALSSGEIASYPNYSTAAVDIDDTAELRDALVEYLHGKDAFDTDLDGDTSEMRDIVLGDLFHSTPVVVGAPSNQLYFEHGYDVPSPSAPTESPFVAFHEHRPRVVYVGSNDGMLHAFHAGTRYAGDNVHTPDPEHGYYLPGSGEELFGYIPGLLLDKVKMIPRNNPRSAYFVDGNPVAADVWIPSDSSDVTKEPVEWTTVLINGFREGGEGYVALDVTDPNASGGDPHGPYPRLLWEFTDSKLGEAWSEPVVARVKLRGSSGSGDHCGANDGDGDCREQWVAIFGGGYRADGNPALGSYVGDPTAPGWSDRGKAIFMVAIDSGQVLAKVFHDASGVNGPAQMVYAIPSAPAVLDLDVDGFADVVYVGDLGGQLWKWDLSDVGEDTDQDGFVDSWQAGVFFRAYRSSVWSRGPSYYRNFYFPPTAGYAQGALSLAFGSGERHDPTYAGDPRADDENRFYVVRDEHPTGSLALATLHYEDDLTDVTRRQTDHDLTDAGFFLVADEGEKFVTRRTVFANFIITASFVPATNLASLCEPASGESFLYVLGLGNGLGFFTDTRDPSLKARRLSLGPGFPSDPRLSLSRAGGDLIHTKTSANRVRVIDAPPRETDVSLIYWRQNF